MRNYWLISIVLALVVLGLWTVPSTPPKSALPPPVLNTSTTTLVYENVEYGFSFALPESWTGYSVVTKTWIGEGEGKTVREGPELFIRHPRWVAEKPRQDIPIMVFTLSEWQDLAGEKFHIGAAPIGPTELGRNATYVFALPARYNYAFPEGFEEVDAIIQSRPLSPLP